MRSENINVTVLSMNKENNERLFNIIKNNLPNVTLKDAKVDDLVTYSDEVSYDLDSTYTKEQMLDISREISDDIKQYVDSRLIDIDTDDMTIIIDEVSKLDFTDYELNQYDLSKYNLSIYPYSSYTIDFNYASEFTYTITLNLEIREDKDHLTEI